MGVGALQSVLRTHGAVVNTVSQIFVSASSLAASLRLFTLSHSQTRRLADLHFRAELCPRCDVEDILRLVHIYDRGITACKQVPQSKFNFIFFHSSQRGLQN